MPTTLATYVRVKAIRRGKFVEFDFSIEDDDLSLELIMPFQAFEEFCHAQNAVIEHLDMVTRGLEGTEPDSSTPVGLYRSPQHDKFTHEQ